MQTPEKLSLIGGSILLSSGLVFGLKPVVASTIPKVEHSVDNVMQGNDGSSAIQSAQQQVQDTKKQEAQIQQESQKEQQDAYNNGYKKAQQDASDKQSQEQAQEQAQKQQAFNNSFDGKFQQAQQKGWQTGTWGTSKYYVDNQSNMQVGGGILLGSFSKVVNDQQIKTINFDESVKAPQDSSNLLSDYSGYSIPLTNINGLDKLNTDQVENMSNMLSDDQSLTNLDLSHLNTPNLNNTYGMFAYDMNLSNLNISNFDTSHVTNMYEMFVSDSIHQLTIGSRTDIDNQYNSTSDTNDYYSVLSGNYSNNGETLNAITNPPSHAGTWILQ